METTLGKFCPVCKFKNELSATTCAYCGASLEPVHKGEATTKHVDEETRILATGSDAEITKRGINAPKKGLAIYLEDGTMLGTRAEKEFFLGRHFEGSHVVLVDLIPFGAIESGVSRQHAVVRQTKNGYEIVDLDSTNGTYIDGDRLVSNQAYPLPEFAQVSLGRMHLLMIYTKDKSSKP